MIYQCHIRLQRLDHDLRLMLANTDNKSDYFRRAIRKYLYKTDDTVPLPTYQHTLPEKTQLIFTLNSTSDKDVIDFLDRIPTGSKNTVCRLLLRNLLEMPDIRQFLDGEEIRVPTTVKEREPVKREQPKQEKPAEITKPQPKERSESIFDLI